MTTVEAYEITVPGTFGTPSTQVFRFCSGNTPVVLSGQTFVPQVMQRDPITTPATGRTAQQKITFRVPVTTDFADLWQPAPPDVTVTIRIYRVTLGDEGNADTVFVGTVLGDRQEGGWHVLEVLPRGSDSGQMVPRGVYSTLCRWALYGPGCGIAPIRRLGTVQAFDPDLRQVTLRVTIAGTSSNPALVNEGRWLAGFCANYVGDLSTGQEISERQTIFDVGAPVFSGTSNVWDITFRVRRWFNRGLPVSGSSTLVLFDGCRKTFEVCSSQFFNSANFGGFPEMDEVAVSPFFDGYKERR